MRNDLDHLKPKYQRELALVAAVLREEFARLSERKVAVRKKKRPHCQDHSVRLFYLRPLGR